MDESEPSSPSPGPIEEEIPIRRAPTFDSSVGLLEGSQTVYELLQTSLERNAKKPCLGNRLKSLDGTWVEYNWLTYAEVFEKARYLASGLIKLGLQPGAMVGIYAPNCAEWVITMIAAQSQSITIVPLYEIAGPKSTQSIIGLTKLTTIISSPNNISKLADAALACHSIKTVVLTGMNEVDVSSLTRQGVQVLSFEAVLKQGKSQPIELRAPSLETIYMIMFTSGDPKGVVMSHKNISTAAISFPKVFSFTSDDVHISYLPLAHIMEHMTVLQCLIAGASLGFWRGTIDELWDDMKVLRPTVLTGVPSVFNRIYASINSNLSKSNPIRRLIFNYGYSSKKKSIELGEDTTFWDKYVFSKLSDPLGGRLRVIISGAAPLTPKVINFLQICFCCPVIQAYGMTETTGALTSTIPNEQKHCGSVGIPLECNEYKLAPVAEMELNDHLTGEVCVRGANLFQGYYGEGGRIIREGIFDDEGWFHTGDVGTFDPVKQALVIVDTKKNLFKLAQGEYVAVDYLQSLFTAGSAYVSQIAIVGRSTENYIVAIVVPKEPAVTNWAKQNKIEELEFAALCRHPAIKTKIFEELVKTANTHQLRGFQIVRNLHLEPHPWTTENGFLTSAGKLRRIKIQKAYKDVIDLLYSQPKMEADKKSKL